ncbi:MAG: hypothetical protein C5B51_15035 [Terriglobia bacterium]|nr:MAG: hypothetical protein C5B51_15035 [Terriglobia bacterium]
MTDADFSIPFHTFIAKKMDLGKTIRLLIAERDRLIKTIASLEQLQAGEPAAVSQKRRGRKFMGARERREVSERMMRYWAKRNAAKIEAVPPDPHTRAAGA